MDYEVYIFKKADHLMGRTPSKKIERLRLDRSVTRVKVLAVTASNSRDAITTIEATSAATSALFWSI